MNKPRDRATAAGLLPRMEARPWSDGKTVSYRYHPVGGKPLALGTDRADAIRKVLELNGKTEDVGTVSRLWAHYKASPAWASLRERTQADYESYSESLLPVFGDVHASVITAPDVARYLRIERAQAPVRANREVALLGNLIGLAIERGEATHNPCRGGQVARNRERPRTVAPEREQIDALVNHANSKGGQWRIIVMAAEFAALAGSRQAELLPLHWPQFGMDEVRIRRAKQRLGVEKVERVAASAALLELRGRLQAFSADGKLGAVFPNRRGNPYTSSGFAAMWGKLMREAVAAMIVTRRFTFHDLRAYYATEHKARTGSLPDLHVNPGTTAKVYERSGVARRNAL
ncbi:tyrosine-type recombinase/integrase [Methylibium sp.]|uniref:tyrosine-type recombinase/integrase n=1 Tax=Methylibium sp. TaxID=2067992 RepID=UPI00182BE777|nr:tyrosine-type recombinase/integrase [Methylibium sp.]MBA3588221.1 tyrosine-type recombinase/integrase [Methylibium sp.]